MNIEVEGRVLKGVSVVGFHGLMTPEATPQRKAPLYELSGSPVRIAGSPWTAKALTLHSFIGEAYELDDSAECVRLAGPEIPAQVGHAFVVVGAWERTYLGQRDAGVHPARAAVRTFVDALRGSEAPEGVRSLPNGGDLLAWYASVADVGDLLETVRRRAKELFFEADVDGRKQAAWKLFQAAPGRREDMLIAAAMLHRHDFEDWKDVVASAVPHEQPIAALSEGQLALAAMDLARRTLASPHPSQRRGPRPSSPDYRQVVRRSNFIGGRAA